ncbi:MAG TPA: cation:proton antiporter [Terriglobales bacterium]|nr:cation:proton antiporter [Terriglobales bacterium]
MEPNPLLFRDLTYIFLAAVVGGLLAWRLRLPLILGFVIGGIAISPYTPGPHLSQLHTFEVFAEVGVVLLMFSIGVEFSVPGLLRVKGVALIGAPLGILIIMGFAVVMAKLLRWNLMEGVVVGAAVSVASTMVLARFLHDSGSLNTVFGRITIAITLVEDVAVICMTVVLPVLAGPAEGQAVKVVWTLGKALILLAPLVVLAMKVIPRILSRAKATEDAEVLLLVTLAICLGTAALAQAAGFSFALGAFLAGFSISSSHELLDVHSQLVPLRDAFVALFFVSLGTLIQPKVLLNSLPLLGLMLLLVVAGKFVVWTGVVRLFRYPLPEAILVAASLTQIGELSFVVVQVARSSGLIAENVYTTTIAASLVSILINVFLMRGVLRGLGQKTLTTGR